MLRSPGRPLVTLLLLAAGCLPPASYDPCVLTGCASPDSSGDIEGSSEGSTEGSSSTEPQDVTTGDGASEGTGTGEDATSSGAPEPAEPPRVLEATWTPNPLLEPGKARIEVVTADVEGLETLLDDEPFMLTRDEDDPNLFFGELEVISELSDGTYAIELLPFRGDIEGETVWVDLKVDLPQAGSEADWSANGELGDGLAGTLLPGPNGELYEFGTRDPAGAPRCYMRRRSAEGKYGPGDVIEVQPGKHCVAVDAANHPDGMLLLSEVTDKGVTLWKLDRHNPWNNSLETEMWGTPGMKGNAVAVGPKGQIAVCGWKQGGPDDKDMAVRSQNPGDEATFDLTPEENPKPHEFSEVANDCVFLGDKLLLAGEASGPHDNIMKRRRHTVIEYDLNTKQTQWRVAPALPEPFVHSSAQAITTDGFGGYITAGHFCEEVCHPWIELRQFAPDGTLLSRFWTSAKTTPPTAVAWHPAGYAVVTAAEIVTGSWSRMWAQAWIPGKFDDLWTFSKSYTEGIHMALDVAVGQYGWVHLVGVSDIGDKLLVPTFVSLYP